MSRRSVTRPTYCDEITAAADCFSDALTWALDVPDQRDLVRLGYRAVVIIGNLRPELILGIGMPLDFLAACAGFREHVEAEGELEFGLTELGASKPDDAMVRLLGVVEGEDEFDMSQFVDRTPLTICAKAPMEFVVEMFGKLGLRHVCVTEEGSGRLVGVIIKKRLVVWLDALKHGH